MHSCDGKAEFIAAITPVRNQVTVLIIINVENSYFCGNSDIYFQNSLMILKSSKEQFILIRNLL